MPFRLKTSPRKQPTQERSKAVVDALIDATSKLLVKSGYDVLNTNRVAEAAGVSVGSLYQYFPSKAALLAGVMERWAEATMAQSLEAMDAFQHAELDVGIRKLVELVLASARRNPRLHRALLEQVPKLGKLDALEQLNRKFEDLLTAWLEARADQLEVDDIPLAAHMVLYSVVRLTDQALLHRPELLAAPKFARHLERLCLAYLTPSKVVQVSGA